MLNDAMLTRCGQIMAEVCAKLGAELVYAPPEPAAPRPGAVAGPAEVFDRAVGHGDEHVVKLADAVLEAHATTGDPRVLAAAGYAGQLI